MTDTPNDWTDNDLEQLSRIAPNAGAPSDHAGEVEELSAKFHEIYQLEAKRQGDVRHKDAYADLAENVKEFDRVLARYVLSLLDAEVTAEVASLDAKLERRNKQLLVAAALEQAAQEAEISSPMNGLLAKRIRALSPSPNYIALREADARIAEAQKWFHERTNPQWYMVRIAALTEARDKLATK